MACRRSDADDAFYLELCFENSFNTLRNGFHLGVAVTAGQFLYNDDIRLVYADDKIMLLIGKQALQDFNARNVGAVDLPYQQKSARYVRSEVKFLCSDIDVSGENIVGNYVFEKCGLIVLFLVIGLGLVKGNGSHHAAYLCHLITAFHKHGIIKLAAAVT